MLIQLWKAFVNGFFDNGEKAAFTKKHTQFKTRVDWTRVQKPCPIYDQRGQNPYPIMTTAAENPYPLGSHITI